MRKTILQFLTAAAAASFFLSSCTTYTKTMREPNTLVRLEKKDFTLSDQVSGAARTVTVLGIDWNRIFVSRAGEVGGAGNISLASIPVVGNFLGDRTSNYALYSLMEHNPRYDVVFYPQYEKKVVRPILGLGFLTKITTVKATARLGRLNNNSDDDNGE